MDQNQPQSQMMPEEGQTDQQLQQQQQQAEPVVQTTVEELVQVTRRQVRVLTAAPPATAAAGSEDDITADKLMAESGQGKTSRKTTPQAEYGYYVIRAAEAADDASRRDYVVAEVRKVPRPDATGGAAEEEVAWFGIFEEHGSGGVGRVVAASLLDSIVFEEGGWMSDPAGATRDAYLLIDGRIVGAGMVGGATAVTAMVLHAGSRLIVGNVGDGRAVLCKDGRAVQLSVDHRPSLPVERSNVELRGGFVSEIPGDVPRVDGRLSVTRAFGDANMKDHLNAKPDIHDMLIDISCEFLVLGSSSLWTSFPTNDDAIDLIKGVSNPLEAAKVLATQARTRGSDDEISCIVIRFTEL